MHIVASRELRPGMLVLSNSLAKELCAEKNTTMRELRADYARTPQKTKITNWPPMCRTCDAQTHINYKQFLTGWPAL